MVERGGQLMLPHSKQLCRSFLECESLSFLQKSGPDRLLRSGSSPGPNRAVAFQATVWPIGQDVLVGVETPACKAWAP